MISCQRWVDDIVAHVDALPGERIIVALAGPPGVGKSTMAELIVEAFTARGVPAAAVPMDGFHFDDAVLAARGLLPRKGAPSTFDVGGLISLLGRLRSNVEDAVAIPLFDRDLELSRAAARVISVETRVLIVEGNYLLLDDAPWPQLRPFFDLTVMLSADRETLRERLVARWLHHGFLLEAAIAKAEANDLLNVDIVLTGSAPADVLISQSLPRNSLGGGR